MGLRDRIGEEFFDDRQEVMQRADGSLRHSIGSAGRAVSRGEQKGSFDETQRDAPLPELTDEAQVEAAEPAWRIGQAKIELQQGLIEGRR